MARGGPRRRQARDPPLTTARALIEALLAGGPAPATTCCRLLRDAGLSESDIRRLRSSLRIRVEGNTRAATWSLPEEPEPPRLGTAGAVAVVVRVLQEAGGSAAARDMTPLLAAAGLSPTHRKMALRGRGDTFHVRGTRNGARWVLGPDPDGAPQPRLKRPLRALPPGEELIHVRVAVEGNPLRLPPLRFLDDSRRRPRRGKSFRRPEPEPPPVRLPPPPRPQILWPCAGGCGRQTSVLSPAGEGERCCCSCQSRLGLI